MRKVLESQDHLTIKQAEVTEIIFEDVKDESLLHEGYTRLISGVKIFSGIIYEAKAVIICTGTILRADVLQVKQ